MEPFYRDGNIVARCPDCDGAITTFSPVSGSIVIDRNHSFDGKTYSRILYSLMKCSGCNRGGLGKIHDIGQVNSGILEWFFPTAIDRAEIPHSVPKGITAEYREAELCASIGAWRASSGLLRSTLEKILRANGYVRGSLAARIDEATADGVITESRRKRAHEEIRVLGNDVLHDEWRIVEPAEVIDSHHYLQRILEDFYDDRSAVAAILTAKNRIPAEGSS